METRLVRRIVSRRTFRGLIRDDAATRIFFFLSEHAREIRVAHTHTYVNRNRMRLVPVVDRRKDVHGACERNVNNNVLCSCED